MARRTKTTRTAPKKKTPKSSVGDFSGLEELKALAESSGGQGRWFRFTEDGTSGKFYFPKDEDEGGIKGFYQHTSQEGKKWAYRICLDQKGNGKCPYCLKGISRGVKVWVIAWNIAEKKMQIVAGGADLLKRLVGKIEKYGSLTGYMVEIVRTGQSYMVEDYPNKTPKESTQRAMATALSDFDLDREMKESKRRDKEREEENPILDEDDLEDDEDEIDEIDEDDEEDDEDLDEEDDEDEDSEDDDDEEDDEEDLDEDEDEEDDDEEEEEEIRPKKTVKKTARVRSRTTARPTRRNKKSSR